MNPPTTKLEKISKIARELPFNSSIPGMKRHCCEYIDIVPQLHISIYQKFTEEAKNCVM